MKKISFVLGFPEFSHFKKYSVIKHHRKGNFSFVKYMNKSHEFKKVNPSNYNFHHLDELCPCAVIRRNPFFGYTDMKENRTLTSKPKYFSWNHANKMCLQTNQTLPEFFSRSEQKDLLNIIKQSKDIFPVEGLFVGLQHKSISQVFIFHFLFLILVCSKLIEKLFCLIVEYFVEDPLIKSG